MPTTHPPGHPPGQHQPGFHESGHDHIHCLENALGRAGELCRERGVRLTPLRRRVLELVWGGHKPLGAYDILDILKSERRGAAPPTVYRTLEFLLKQGLVHRIESLNSFVGCPFPDQDKPHGGQFLICRSCGLTAEMNDHQIDQAIKQSADKIGFAIARPMIEIEGLCPQCRPD
ncbi:MAG: Fur family transcriptional regulator [Proteobacteria bacterium]|nr:Fur family transcriptional regulator [Pseudomonadota bacterium]MDA1023149.1 Fur family transcriptional regulator [Pseudomonadota bacterium]